MTAQPSYRPSPLTARPLPARPAPVGPGPGSTGPGSTGPGSTGPGSTGPGSTGPGNRAPGDGVPRRRAARTLVVVVALLLVLAWLAATALHLFGTRTVQPATVQSEIVRITVAAVQVAPTDVRCPEGIAAQAGATFTCTGAVDGQPVTWWVHQDDDQGHMTVTADRLLRLDALERTVATKVGSDLRTPVTVDCRPANRMVLRNTPGQEIDCTATRTAGPGGPVRITVTVDENGVTAYRVA